VDSVTPENQGFDSSHARAAEGIEDRLARGREGLDVLLDDVPGPLSEVRVAAVVAARGLLSGRNRLGYRLDGDSERLGHVKGEGSRPHRPFQKDRASFRSCS
jgi:hypothetical protein